MCRMVSTVNILYRDSQLIQGWTLNVLNNTMAIMGSEGCVHEVQCADHFTVYTCINQNTEHLKVTPCNMSQ